MTTVRLLLGYYHPWPNDIGFTLARHHGRYDEGGLDVRIGVVDPGRGDTLAHLARDEADLAVVPSNRLLAARARGQAVAAVAAVNQVGLETLHSLRSLGVARPRDLAGRRVALNPAPRGLAMVRHLVRVDGGDPDSLVIVDSGPRELQSADLVAGTAEAYFGAYWAWDELFDTHPADDRVSWPVKDHGAPAFHSYLLVAREAWADEHPDALAALLSGSEAGFRAAAADPEAAAEHFGHVTPYFPAAVLRRSVELVAPTWFHDDRWGVLRDDLLTRYAHWLADHGALPDLAGLTGAARGTLAPVGPASGGPAWRAVGA
ncbi:MAG TPA: ABC transporter substrate-binding protein [Cellulomonas sp.]